MGFFTRTRDIINSNINSALEKAEDPEKMIKLMVREMEDSLIEIKSSLAEKISLKSVLKRDLSISKEKAEMWQNRAVMAIDSKKDDLAREALIHKRNFENESVVLEKEYEHTEKVIGESRENLIKIEEKLEEVIQKKRLLIQRGLHAAEKKRVNRVLHTASSSDAVIRFDELESRIERMEAEAELGTKENYYSEFNDMERDKEIEDELEKIKALKKRSKKT